MTRILSHLFTVYTLGVLSVNAQISDEFLARVKQLGSTPTAEELVNFGNYIRTSEEQLSRDERVRADRAITNAISSFSMSEMPSILERLQGVRSAGLVRVALATADENGSLSAGAESFIASSPAAVVDYFLVSSDGTRINGDLLFDLKGEALELLRREMIERDESRGKLRAIGLLSQVLGEKGNEIDQSAKQSVLEDVQDQLDYLEPGDRDIAKAYFARDGVVESGGSSSPQDAVDVESVEVSDAHRTQNPNEFSAPTNNPNNLSTDGGEVSADTPRQSPLWPYVLFAVALVGIVVILVRSRKGKSGS